MTGVAPSFSSEVQLMNWGESSNSGAWVKFWIDADDLEAFRHLKTRSGKIAGHRFACVLVEIGDDEQPVPAITSESSSEVKEKQQPPKGGEWAKLAGMWCNDRDFWMWANSQTHNGVMWHVKDAKTAGEFVREYLDIDSRVVLDHDAEALTQFNEHVRFPFQKWMLARGIKK